MAFAGGLAVRTALSKELAKDRTYVMAKAAADGFSDAELHDLMDDAGPAAWRIAIAHDPDSPQRAWARPAGWERLDVETPPTLRFTGLSFDDARRINGVIPFAAADSPPAQPFVLKGPERAAAVDCMTTAIYYEAALEPREGQEAVAQVILNRMHHADYPKSVCGVVFQGAEKPGCQFSFACDGSMARPPAAWAWKNAKEVAEQALSGFVMKGVGTATHYHTSYIMARWTPTLVKVGQYGQHLFFRPPGPEGMPEAFRISYRGGELRASRVDMIGKPQVVATPDVLLDEAADGSPLAGGAATRDGRTIVLPASTILLGRVHGVITEDGGMQSGLTPMHAMIAMRAAAARAVKAAEREQNSIAAASNPVATAAAPAAPDPAKSAG